MSNQDYKRPDIPKKAKPYALLSFLLFIVSVFLTFFALIFKSIPIFIFALPSWGLLTIIKVLYNKMVPLPLRKEINEKILSPLPMDENEQESVLIPVRKHSLKIHYSIVLPVLAIIFILVMLFFINDHTNFTIATLLIFLILTIGITFLIIRNVSHTMVLEKEINPFAIKISKNGIVFPSTIVEKFPDVASVKKYVKSQLHEFYLSWHDIKRWEVVPSGDCTPSLYTLELNNGTCTIDRSLIFDEITLLDSVRKIGQKSIILRDDIIKR